VLLLVPPLILEPTTIAKQLFRAGMRVDQLAGSVWLLGRAVLVVLAGGAALRTRELHADARAGLWGSVDALEAVLKISVVDGGAVETETSQLADRRMTPQ